MNTKELEKRCNELFFQVNEKTERIAELEKENAELRKIAEFQQSSNMNTHLENKKLKEGLVVGSTFNKALNSMNKSLEEERDKYRDMVFDLQQENAEFRKEWQEQVQKATDEGYARTLQTIQLNNAKEIIRDLINLTEPTSTEEVQHWNETFRKAEQFLKDSEVENDSKDKNDNC